MLKKVFLEHPATVDETYGEHFVQAMLFSGRMLGAAGACFIHAFIPCLFKQTGSCAIAELHERMIVKRAEQTPRRRNALRAS